MANSLPIENVLIQVRAKLQTEQIKLWLPPYYEEGIGPIESELEVRIPIAEFRFSSVFKQTSLFHLDCRN